MSQAIDPGIEIAVGTISIIAPVNYNQSIRVIPDTSKQNFAQNHVCPCPSASSFISPLKPGLLPLFYIPIRTISIPQFSSSKLLNKTLPAPAYVFGGTFTRGSNEGN
jgi:hypothetical protein